MMSYLVRHHLWSNGPCVNSGQGPQQGNLIGILCLISPHEDRITMPSLSDTKGERM